MYLFYVLVLVSIVSADFSEEEYNEVKKSRDFTGKVVLVTGSSSGIGEGIVKLFSVLGANVVVTGRNEKRVKQVAEEVKRLSPKGLEPLEVIADLTKSEDLENLLKKTIEKYGKLDVLVNNAGMVEVSAITDKNFMEVFDDVFNIDLRAVVELIHLSVPYLEESNGTIISTSSVNSLVPMPTVLAYCSAKAAIDMMTKVLALELGPRVRVNAINPGMIQTTDDPRYKDRYDQMAKITPLKRVGQPLDIAKGVAFLASSDAQFITGANVVIDGGLRYTIT